MTEWNWDKQPYRLDPLTNKSICFDCWHNNHRIRGNKPGCGDAQCQCLCFAMKKNIAHERGVKAANTVARKALMREMLESEDNPLRAENPLFE